MQNFKVDEDNANARLDRWAKRFLPDVPHSMLNRMLRKGQLRVNGKKAEANHRLKSGDEIIIKGGMLGDWETNKDGTGKKKRSQKQSENAAGCELPEETLINDFNKLIIFENNDYVIINKPSGLPSQGGSGIKVSVDDMIGAVSERYKLVHRLDKDTSGVLAIAKKTTAAATFSKLLQGKEVTKIYWALVKGVPPKMKGVIKLSLAKRGDKMEKVEVDDIDGKKSVTEYTVIERLAREMSWLELSPITGRTHQLRVHCAAIGCPIIGDGKYGGADSFEKGLSNKLHLHARRLVVKQLGIDVTAKLPEHMKAVEPNV